MVREEEREKEEEEMEARERNVQGISLRCMLQEIISCNIHPPLSNLQTMEDKNGEQEREKSQYNSKQLGHYTRVVYVTGKNSCNIHPPYTVP